MPTKDKRIHIPLLGFYPSGKRNCKWISLFLTPSTYIVPFEEINQSTPRMPKVKIHKENVQTLHYYLFSTSKKCMAP
jgi:hypothetical protein